MRITHEQARQHLQDKIQDANILVVLDYIKQQEKQEKLLELYKAFFDELKIELRNTFDIDYIHPHEFLLGYDIKSEDNVLIRLFKEIKELEK